MGKKVAPEKLLEMLLKELESGSKKELPSGDFQLAVLWALREILGVLKAR